MHISISHRRLRATILFFFLLFTLCLSRLAYIQFFKSRYLSAIANQQHNLYLELEPVRGAIRDRNSKPLAFNVPSDSLYGSPRQIKNKEKVIIALPKVKRDANDNITMLNQKQTEINRGRSSGYQKN